jgi:hypothetical protein
MTYMFFESTHAAYDFPPDSVIAKPYLEDLNYLTTDFKVDIQLIKNRYSTPRTMSTSRSAASSNT